MTSASRLESPYVKLDNLDDLYNTPLGDHISRTTLGRQGEENQSLCASFSFRERLIGFGACMIASVICSILAWIKLFLLQLETFAVIYTVSNIFSIGSTFFLCGPVRQFKNMFAAQRWLCALVFIACMALTFVFAIGVRIPLLTIISVLLQYLAMTWYALSYIPFARDAILACFGMRR